MPADWTMAFDDFFREVIQHCAACGRPAPRLRHATWVYMSPGTGREIAFAMGICHRCEYQPDWWTRVDHGVGHPVVAYLGAADNVSRLLPSPLSDVNQPVIRSHNPFSRPHPARV